MGVFDEAGIVPPPVTGLGRKRDAANPVVNVIAVKDIPLTMGAAAGAIRRAGNIARAVVGIKVNESDIINTGIQTVDPIDDLVIKMLQFVPRSIKISRIRCGYRHSLSTKTHYCLS